MDKSNSMLLYREFQGELFDHLCTLALKKTGPLLLFYNLTRSFGRQI